MANIVFFKGQSQYNVITSYVDADKNTLEKRGHSVQIISLTEPFDGNLGKCLTEADLVVGYCGWGWDLRLSDGRPVFDHVEAPYLALLGDHPSYTLSRLAFRAPHHHMVLSAEVCRRFVKEHLNIRTGVHMGMCTYNAPPEFSWGGRDIDIVAVGSIYQPDSYLASNCKDAEIRKAIRDGYKIWRNEHSGYYDTFFLFLETTGQDMLQRQGLGRALEAAKIFDIYCRQSYRIEMARKLKDFPITLVGSGWKKVCAGFKHNFRILPSMSYPKYIELLRRVKIAINLLPPFFDFHERIVDSAANGAAVITNPTDWISTAYKFGEQAIALPSVSDDVADILAPVLSAPDKAADIAEAGAARVRAAFTEEARGAAYEEFLETKTFAGAFAYSSHDGKPPMPATSPVETGNATEDQIERPHAVSA